MIAKVSLACGYPEKINFDRRHCDCSSLCLRKEGLGAQAMEVIYKSRHIHTWSELNGKLDCWISMADVSWDEAGTKCCQQLVGSIGYSKIIEEAESYALEMAKTWIDSDTAENLTP